jgi:hypothetical protein
MMTKHVYILFSLLLFLQKAYSFEAYVVNNKFYAPKIGSYVETELLIPASKLKFVKNNNGKFQAQIEVTLLYKKNNEIIGASNQCYLSLNRYMEEFGNKQFIDIHNGLKRTIGWWKHLVNKD